MFDPSTINCNSVVNKFTACMKSVFIFGWTDEQIYLPIWIDEIGKNQDKLINETSVSSISTVWSIQSITIKSDFPIFIDWLLRVSIAVDVTIFGTNWDQKKNRNLKQGRRRRQWKRRYKNDLSNLLASIWTRSKCQMQATSHGVEFSRILFKFKKRKENSSSYVHVFHKTAN